MSWRDDAACLAAVRKGEAHRDDWFPEGGKGRGGFAGDPASKRAIAICRTCPVQEPCLDEFVRLFPGMNVRFGIIAGRVFNGSSRERAECAS